MTSTSEAQISQLLSEAEERLRNLSPERLRVASDFLAYLQEREENEATQELLAIPGLETALQHAAAQADCGDTVRAENDPPVVIILDRVSQSLPLRSLA